MYSNRDRNHMTALHASVTARYSATAEDCAGAPDWSLHPKSTRSPLRKIRCPPLLLLVSGHDACPASTQTVMRTGSPRVHPLFRKINPWFFVPPACCHA